MRRILMLVVLALVLAPTLTVPANAAGPKLRWSGFQGVAPGTPLSAAATSLGTRVVMVCGAHGVRVGSVILDDRVTGDNRATNLHTTDKRVRGPKGVHVGMKGRAFRSALGPRVRDAKVRGLRTYLLVGKQHRTLWATATGRSKKARIGEMGLASTKAIAKRAAALRGCPANPSPPVAPPPCPDALPASGPYQSVTCDPATGMVAPECYPGWVDTNGVAADGCEARAGGSSAISFDDDSAALALRARLLGTFNQAGYGPNLPDDTYVGPDPVLIEVQPSCDSDSRIDCPGETPSSPPSTLALDVKEYPADAARADVVPVDGQMRFDVTLRFRVTTPTPIPISFEGLDCIVDIDSTTDATPPDLRLTASLQKGAAPGAEVGPLDIGADLLVTQLDSDDVSIGGGAVCQLASSAFPPSSIQELLQPTFAHWLSSGPLCGAPAPYYWQACPPPD